MSSRIRLAIVATVCVVAGCGGGERNKDGSSWDSVVAHVELESSGGHQSSKKDWPMSQYEATGSGFNDKENKLKRSNVGELEVKWVFDDTDASEPVTSVNANPVVSDGKTFVGTVTGRFFAIDETGHELWKFTAGPASSSIAPFLGPTSPIFAGALLPEREDTVIVGDSDGRLYKLDRATGAMLWTTDVDDNDLGGFWGNSLVLAGDTIYAGLASFEPLAPFLVPGRPCCSHRGGVVAVDVATGAVRWRYEAVEQSEQGPFPQALIDQLGGVETFGPSGGDVWSSPTFDRKTNTVYISTGQLFSRRPDGTGTGTFDAVIALDAANGHEKWKRQFSDNLDVFRFDIPFFDPATGQFFDKDMSGQPKIYELENGRRVVAAGQKSGELHVLDAETGAVVASTKHLVMVTGEGGFQSGGATDGERLFEHGGTTPADPAMVLDGVVMALNSKGTKVLWSVDIPGSALYGSVAVAGGVVYFQSPFEDGPAGPPTWALYAVRSETGEVLNRITFPNQRALNGPAVSRGRVYAGFGGAFVFGPATPTPGGGVVCLGLPD